MKGFSILTPVLTANDSKICIAPKNIKNKSGYYGFSNNKDIKPRWWKDI